MTGAYRVYQEFGIGPFFGGTGVMISQRLGYAASFTEGCVGTTEADYWHYMEFLRCNNMLVV